MATLHHIYSQSDDIKETISEQPYVVWRERDSAELAWAKTKGGEKKLSANGKFTSTVL